MDFFQGFSAELTNEALQQLRNDSDVDFVEVNHQCHVASTVQNNPPWNLARINQRSQPLSPNFIYDDEAGRLSTIYVLDTGIRLTHSEFEGKIF